MLRKLLVAIALLLHIGLVFAQSSIKPPPSPFTLGGGLNASNLPNTPPPLPQIQPAPVNNDNIIIAGNSQVWGSPPAVTEEQKWQQMVNENNQAWQQLTSNVTGEETLQDPNLINNISDKVYTKFKDKFTDIAIKLKPYVLYIFYILAIFNVLWLLFTHMLQGLIFKEFIVNFLINLFYFFLWERLIMNFPEIASYIPHFLKKIGIAVSTVPITEATILDYGVNYIKAVWNNLKVGQPAVAIMYIVLSVPTFLMILRMVQIYVFVLMEGLVIGQLNIIYLAFAGVSSLDSYAKKPFMYLVSIGLKLMFLQIFFGAILSIIAEYSVMPITQDLVIVMLISTALCYVLVNSTMDIVNNFIMGNASSTQFGSMKIALKDTLLDTYRAIQSMNEVKNLMDKAKEMQQQQAMEKMHDPEFAQRFAPKFDRDNDSNNSNNVNNSNSSNFDKANFSNNQPTGNTPASQNSTTQGAGFNQNNLQNFATNSKFDTTNSATSQNNTNSSSNNNTANQQESKNQNSSAHAGPTNENDKTNAFNQSSQANQSIPNNSTLNKVKDAVGSLGTATKALLDNDFSLKKANQHLDRKLQEGETRVNKALMSATDESQAKLWNKIYLGQSPSYSDEARKYIQHGNDLKNKPEYAQKYTAYVEQRRQEYQEQIQNSILPLDNNQTNQTNKGNNEA